MVTDYSAFHFICMGASHIKSGSVCQDSSRSGETASCKYAVVCDGHGGADYFRSDRGSAFAAEVFGECAADADFLNGLGDCKNEKQRNERLIQLTKSIITRWNSLVDADIKANPFSAEELQAVTEKALRSYEKGELLQAAYGTTLVGAVLTDSFWFGLQIGDGKCVEVSENGSFTQPIPWDDSCFLNVTTSLCDENALSEFRYYFGLDAPAAVFLGSDGIDDCFAGDEKLNDFYRVVLKSFAVSESKEACEELQRYLPTLSEKGSGDDMSVAILINTDFVRAHEELYEKQKKIFLHITHDGNIGGDNPNDTYFQQADIEAVPGIYSLSELDCGGFYNVSRLTFEIVSACAQSILLRISNREYTLTPEAPVEITLTDTETSNDGPRFTAYDTLELCMTEK